MFLENHFLYFFIFILDIIILVSSRQTNSFFLENILQISFPQCKPSDYCMVSDREKSYLNQFSTKSAYQIREPLDDKKDYEIQGEYKSTLA